VEDLLAQAVEVIVVHHDRVWRLGPGVPPVVDASPALPVLLRCDDERRWLRAAGRVAFVSPAATGGTPPIIASAGMPGS
jgi:hypothetical protein